MSLAENQVQLLQHLNTSLEDLDVTKFLQDHALNHRLAVCFPIAVFLLAPSFNLIWPSIAICCYTNFKPLLQKANRDIKAKFKEMIE